MIPATFINIKIILFFYKNTKYIVDNFDLLKFNDFFKIRFFINEDGFKSVNFKFSYLYTKFRKKDYFMQITFSHTIKLRVRYGETDKMGYCYYGNYAQYFEVGRVEALRSLGISYKSMEDSGYMLPVSEFKVNYFRPAYYDDELSIITSLTGLRGAKLFFEYEIQNEAGVCLSKASTILVFASMDSGRPIQPPVSFMQAIQHYV
jgi:acyl-CoA thioester hydrolase